MSSLEFELPRSLNDNSNGSVGFLLYDFLLVPNNNHMSISHRLPAIGTETFFLSILIMSKFWSPRTHPQREGPFQTEKVKIRNLTQ